MYPDGTVRTSGLAPSQKSWALLQGKAPLAAEGPAPASSHVAKTGGSGSAGAAPAAEGDAAFSALNPGMAFMMECYEDELKRPIRNLVNGQLLRTILIQAERPALCMAGNALHASCGFWVGCMPYPQCPGPTFIVTPVRCVCV